MKKWFELAGILFFVLMLMVACGNNESTEPPSGKGEAQTPIKEVELTISAAASLKDAMEVIEKNFKDKYPKTTLQFNFGASGSLQQQISQGAPVDLFFSAAEDKFDLLVDEGAIAAEDRMDLLGNSIVLVAPRGNSSIQSMEDLANVDGKIAIGTPETVPAGKYAQESLENMGIWKDIEAKIVYAKDVRQVLSYVETGNVEAGMIYKTDAAVSDKIDIVASADASTHTPIIYPVGIIKDSKQYEAAKQFYEYLQSDEAIKVFEEYGFTAQS